MEINESPLKDLDAYARIPISFTVSSVFDVSPTANGWILHERFVTAPYVKDYDFADEGPASWAVRFDVSHWRCFVARLDERIVGGAVLAFAAPSVHMLEGRSDLAVLWDIRVAPARRGRGIGRELFAAAESWAARNGYVELKVETQNVNVPACRFYASMGCELKDVRYGAYPSLPDEIQLIWRKSLR